MSHTLRKINLGNSAFAESNIIDYAQGGEPYTLAELGIVGPISFSAFLIPDSWNFTNSIKPRLQGANIILESAPGIEIPSTLGLNYTFIAIVHGA